MISYDVTFRLRAPDNAEVRKDVTAEHVAKHLIPLVFPRLPKGASIDVMGSAIVRVDDKRETKK